MSEIDYVLLNELEAWLQHELEWRQRIENPTEFCKGEMTMIKRLTGSLARSKKRLQSEADIFARVAALEELVSKHSASKSGDTTEAIVSDHLEVTRKLDLAITDLKHRVGALEVISAGVLKGKP